MKTINKALFLAVILFNYSVYSDESLIKPQIQGDVTYLSGGVGGEEHAAIQAVRSDYNLHLLFSARGTGEYLSDVTVNISDSTGTPILDTVAEGPMLLAKLKPGKYTVTAEFDGKVSHKKVKIGKNGRSALSFVW